MTDIEYRQNCERILRSAFATKGGIMTRTAPYDMVVERSPWLSTWYENTGFIKIPLEEFDSRTLSFTHADPMPTFSPAIHDGKEYRCRLYTYHEILKVIERYGLPQEWMTTANTAPKDRWRFRYGATNPSTAISPSGDSRFLKKGIQVPLPAVYAGQSLIDRGRLLLQPAEYREGIQQNRAGSSDLPPGFIFFYPQYRSRYRSSSHWVTRIL